METLILASSSPRRKDILNLLSIPFVALSPDIDESVFASLEPAEQVKALSEAKARKGCELFTSSMANQARQARFLLAADTLVAYQKEARCAAGYHVVGKPKSEDDARRMLQRLQGRTHLVFTAIYLLDLHSMATWQALSESKVKFAPMSKDEIELYLSSGEWQGVAGAYRLQGRGAWFIESVQGSPSGVMGLPIHELYGILKQSGYDLS